MSLKYLPLQRNLQTLLISEISSCGTFCFSSFPCSLSLHQVGANPVYLYIIIKSVSDWTWISLTLSQIQWGTVDVHRVSISRCHSLFLFWSCSVTADSLDVFCSVFSMRLIFFLVQNKSYLHEVRFGRGQHSGELGRGWRRWARKWGGLLWLGLLPAQPYSQV